MIIKKAVYVTSVVSEDKLIQDSMPEIAFVGRSNVGKSSLLNMLTNQRKLAKTSSTPGHTKMVNYFLINDNFKIIDLPGYGFSKANKGHEANWAHLIESYLLKTTNLKMVYVLVDIRHEPSELDKLMCQFLYFNKLPFVVIATKADKLSKSQLFKSKQMIANGLAIGRDNIIIVDYNGIGKQSLLDSIENAIV